MIEGDARMARHGIVGLALGALLLILPVGCGKDKEEASAPQTTPTAAESSPQSADASPVELQPDAAANASPADLKAKPVQPEVEISTSLGVIRLRLFPEKAPRTVDNFLENYVERQAYDKTIVHFVDPTFMVAMGGFDTSYRPIETRPPILNEADNGLKNTAGTVAMARMPDYVHSATSQFFINVVDNPSLDYREEKDGSVNGYCVFGKVVSGMDVVKKIAQVATEDRDGFPSTPKEPIVVQSVRRVK